MFCQTVHAWSLGPGQGQLYHLLWQNDEELGDHANGNPHHRYSGKWEAWDGDCLLLLWPGKGRAISSSSDPCSMRFTWAGHGSGEDLHQFSLDPMGVFWLLFSSHSHPAWHCLNYPISTLMVTPEPAASVLPHSHHPAEEKEGNELTITPITKEALWELLQGALSIIPGITLAAALGPSHIPQHLWGKGFADWWKTQLHCGSEAAASSHSGKVPTWVGAALWTVQAECEGRWADCQGIQHDLSCHHQVEGTVGWQTGGPVSWGVRAICHHIHGGPLSNESSRLSEVAHLAQFYCWQSWCGFQMLCGWSAHCCLTTEDGGLCSIGELSCPSVYSFTGINNSPACWACPLPPPTPSISDIQVSCTPVRFSSLMLIISTPSRKCDHSSDSVSNDQCDKRAHIGIKVEPINDGSHGSNISTRSAPPVTVYDTSPIKGDGEWEPLFNTGDAESGCGLPPVQPRSSNTVQPKT